MEGRFFYINPNFRTRSWIFQFFSKSISILNRTSLASHSYKTVRTVLCADVWIFNDSPIAKTLSCICRSVRLSNLHYEGGLQHFIGQTRWMYDAMHVIPYVIPNMSQPPDLAQFGLSNCVDSYLKSSLQMLAPSRLKQFYTRNVKYGGNQSALNPNILTLNSGAILVSR